MAHDPEIERWLQSRDERKRLDELEEQAAEAWWNSLSPEQREVFAELHDAYHGMACLRNKLRAARFEAGKKH